MPFAARTVLLCAAVALLGASGKSGNAALLAQMRAAAGPVWRAHFVSVARLSFEGAPAVVSTESEGAHVYVRQCTGELCTGTYFDGERLFSVTLNGTMLPQSVGPQPFLRSLVLVATLGFLSPNFVVHGGIVTDGGDAALGGRRYRTIVMGDPFSIPLRVYVDPVTKLVRYARDLGGSDTFEFRDYRRTGAFVIPYDILHDGKPFERFDDRVAVSTAFYPPHGLLAGRHDAVSTIATDPSAVEPIVDCSIGGVAVRCLIDSGNSGLGMSASLAARLNAPSAGNYEVRGLGGYSTRVVRAGPLRVGDFTFSEAYYVVLPDLQRYGYDAVLGADFLGTSTVVWDGAAHEIRLNGTLDPHGISVPLTFARFVPVAHVALGDVPADLAVDTGDESNINLSYDYYSKHPNLFTVTSRRSVSGIGGSSFEVIGEIADVTIGGYRTGSQHIGATWTLRATADGHLGAAFWQQFVVDFDYAGSELRLIPRHS